jgi:hypothetical protein
MVLKGEESQNPSRILLEGPTSLTDITITDGSRYLLTYSKPDELPDNDFEHCGMTTVVRFYDILMLLKDRKVKWKMIWKIKLSTVL